MAWSPVTATGTGASQTVTIPESGLTVDDIEVFVNGVLQAPTTNYTLSGTTVTITTDSAGDYIRILKPAGGSITGTAGPASWGSITGTLSSQTDLQTALNAKAPTSSPTFTGTVSAAAIAASGNITAANKVDGKDYTVTGTTLANERYVLGIFQYPVTISQTNSAAKSLVAATGSTVFTLKKGTIASPTTIGTFTFGAASTTATVSITAGSISSGDLAWIEAPASPDSTLQDIAFVVRS
jgi:hypothetical protein